MYSYGPPHTEDLPEAMNDWDKWREMVGDIRAAERHDDDDDENSYHWKSMNFIIP